MRCKAVIFDLDGVICSTDKYHFLAWKQLADELGVPFDESVNDLLRGLGRMESLDIILRRSGKIFSEDEKQRLAERKNEIYRGYLQNMSCTDRSDGVMDTLEALRERGLRLAIGSSSKNARLLLKQLGLEDYFDAVADGTQITHSKPDPEVFLLAARLLSVAPAQAAVVEDAQAGVTAARNGGFYAVGLHIDADARISSLRELPGVISAWEYLR